MNERSTNAKQKLELEKAQRCFASEQKAFQESKKKHQDASAFKSDVKELQTDVKANKRRLDLYLETFQKEKFGFSNNVDKLSDNHRDLNTEVKKMKLDLDAVKDNRNLAQPDFVKFCLQSQADLMKSFEDKLEKFKTDFLEKEEEYLNEWKVKILGEVDTALLTFKDQNAAANKESFDQMVAEIKNSIAGVKQEVKVERGRVTYCKYSNLIQSHN